MEQKQYYTKASDSIRLFVRHWTPDGSPLAHIVLIHGFSEHSGRYIHWTERFVSHGISITAFDLRGHGKSGGLRGHTPSFRQLMRDLDQILHEVPLSEDLPLFLYGQSLGGGLVLSYGLNRREGFDGIIATSPWLKLSTEPKAFVLLLSRGLKILAPRTVRDSKLDINYLSHDPEVIREYEKDPLTHRKITPHLFFGARKAGYKALRHARKLEHPLLLMHGTGDKITSFRASEQFAQNAVQAKRDVQFIPWEGLYHELHHEVEKDHIFTTMLHWIREKAQIKEKDDQPEDQH